MGSKKSRFSPKISADSYSEASPEYKYGVIDPIEYIGGEVGPHLMFRMCRRPNRSATPRLTPYSTETKAHYRQTSQVLDPTSSTTH